MGSSISRPALDLLDLFLCLWQCYVVKSAEKIRLQRERRQLRLSNDELKAENGLLQQRCNEQALVLWDRGRAAHAVQNGIVSILRTCDRNSDQKSYL
jgi:hypothetical protein